LRKGGRNSGDSVVARSPARTNTLYGSNRADYSGAGTPGSLINGGKQNASLLDTIHGSQVSKDFSSIQNPKLVPDPDPGSKIAPVPIIPAPDHQVLSILAPRFAGSALDLH
jgi:hypothetical protein